MCKVRQGHLYFVHVVEVGSMWCIKLLLADGYLPGQMTIPEMLRVAILH